MILDGWGIGNGTQSDVIKSGNTPYIDSLKAKYPNSQLLTDGENVGLPEGQMGWVPSLLVERSKSCELVRTIQQSIFLKVAYHLKTKERKKERKHE